MEEIVVYTPDEVAKILKTASQNVLGEIQSGRLQAFKVGNEWRITEKSIVDFISSGSPQSGSEAGSVGDYSVPSSCFRSASPFQHVWPSGGAEEYNQAYEGTVETSDRQFQIKIGIGERAAAGKRRKRVVIFVDGRPTVEFAGTDDFEQTGLVASAITLPSKKRLKPRQPVPAEYRRFDVRQYNSLVTGPRALSTMAVVSRIDDLSTMVSHALIRTKYREG
jgi:excisionase family DNA binding protein